MTADEKKAGWKLLFDGTTFKGWRDVRRGTPPGDSWTIEDGALKAVPKPKLREDLFTVQEYGDFELAFEWRIAPGANSGVKYRIQDRFLINEKRIKEFKRFEDLANDAIRSRATTRAEATQEYVVGFEYQLIDDAGHADARRGEYYQAGSLYDIVARTKPMAKPVGEYNQSRIVVRGTKIEHWLNGEKVVEGDLSAETIKARAERRWTRESPVYALLANQPRRKSPVALQNHGDAAWFRTIRIRPLR
ncbi:MAG: DUF1080 domain-containing protein [Acidobacteria bacterium]|nr:DUF1080 domain-containing protein [Acidobacteriota bacterium]